jgi:hypothetical protein
MVLAGGKGDHALGVAMGKKVEHAPLMLSPRKRTKKEGYFG